MLRFCFRPTFLVLLLKMNLSLFPSTISSLPSPHPPSLSPPALPLLFLSPALLSATAVNYVLSLVSLVMFYIYYTHADGCTENKVFISVNMLLCVGSSVLSILPQIQVNNDISTRYHTRTGITHSDWSLHVCDG